MPNKQFLLDDDLPVSIYKRRSSRNLRLTISATGEVRVSIPYWAPYSAGLAFAKSKREWILAQRKPGQLLVDGQSVGKAHHLRFTAKDSVSKPTSRVVPGSVIVSYPSALSVSDLEVQKAAQTGCIRALRSQAEQLLPQRLAALAKAHDFTYKSISIKRLKGRWGSCDQHKNIVLNLFLMQLPWEFIDYVLLHELTHTKVMRHGPDFWSAMSEINPDSRSLRKRLHEYPPALHSPSATDVT